ncbi:WXG100 family type VII secretion target [Nocardia alni]|uniref:WXG100 family type VII secretion target n=1 Tax=Nocardia alni TaxID=2815723 RepID=UPI001C24E48A|nr:WXG100 family type VII secretion target [Nocardia alni]
MTIRAQFGNIDESAQRIVQQAQGLQQKLEEFHKSVQDYVTNSGAGAANDAFGQLQRTWNQRSMQLGDTLNQAGKVVGQGNQDLQSKDQSLAGMFGN